MDSIITMLWFYLWTLILIQETIVINTPIFDIKPFSLNILFIYHTFIPVLYVLLGCCCSHGSRVATPVCVSANPVPPYSTPTLHPYVVSSSSQQIHLFFPSYDYD